MKPYQSSFRYSICNIRFTCAQYLLLTAKIICRKLIFGAANYVT